jgi:proteasome accessory factor A
MSSESMTRTLNGASEARSGSVPKVCGADVELGNFILGEEEHFRAWFGTGRQASNALFKEMPGIASNPDRTVNVGASQPSGYFWTGAGGLYIPSASYGGYQSYNPQSWVRKFMPGNGGCSYIDHAHLELCIPEVISAYDHVAAWHAMLRITRSALKRANAKLSNRSKIQVLVNNSDGMGNSYGSHTNFLISRRCFDNIFQRKLHYTLSFVSYLTSSIVFTGAGKVGSENRRPPVDFQIAQRADFFESLMGSQTTFSRPLVNSRDEALCTRSSMARLHVIFFDNTLCHVSSMLKVGVTQILLAMIEQDQVNSHVILQDPLDAVLAWSHDPDLCAKARLISGAQYTAVEMQLAILEKAQNFVGAGRADGIVPNAHEIVELWEDTLLKLYSKDFAALTPRLDWVLKLSILQQAMKKHPELTEWDSPQLKHLDHLYSSLEGGLYWIYESNLVQRLVSEEAIERFMHEPPNDTRAWLRAYILRHGADSIDSVDWDVIRFRFSSEEDYLTHYVYKTLSMENPLLFTKEQCEPVLEEADSLEEALDSLGLEQTDSYGRPLNSSQGTTSTHLPGVAAPKHEYNH